MLVRLPLETTVGGTVGVAQQFGRFDTSLKGTFDRSMYQNSVFTDGETVSNAYRNFDQYAGILRVGYEIDPGIKPFVEISEDSASTTRSTSIGEQRDSTGTSVKIGGTFNLFGSLTGEMAVGYIERDYKDPICRNQRRRHSTAS